MSIFNVAYMMGETVLGKGTLDIDYINKYWTPYSVGTKSFGWRKPHPLCLPGEAGNNYINFCSLHQDGIGEWIEIMRIIRDHHGYSLQKMDYTTFILYARLNLNCAIESYKVPVVQQSVLDSRTTTVTKYVTIAEYMELFGFSDMGVFFNHIVQFIIFGFPLTEYYARVFKVIRPDAYFASRLFQGYGDLWLMLYDNNPRQPSYFVNPDELDQEPDMSNSLDTVTTALMMGAKRQKMMLEAEKQTIRTLLNKGHFANVNSEMMTTLERTKMFSMDAEYSKYVKQSSYFSKVSIALFYLITRAYNPKPDNTSENFTAFESACSTNNYTGMERNLFRN